jgi:hypothetical protein
MADYITLLGAEDVVRAANNMQSAADTFKQSVGHLDDILRRHEENMAALVFRQEELARKALEE